jgi:hypothetical protein
MVHLRHLCIQRKGDKNGVEERYRTYVVLLFPLLVCRVHRVT